MFVHEIINATKHINGQVYIGEGSFAQYHCSYNPPTAQEKIIGFESIYSVTVPEDYVNFLLVSNGMQFYEAGDFSFYSLQQIEVILKTMKEASVPYKDGIFPIAYVLGDYIVIKSDAIASGKYIYAGSCYCRDEYFSLECNFETFFDRCIITNLCNYWRWLAPVELFDFIGD